MHSCIDTASFVPPHPLDQDYYYDLHPRVNQSIRQSKDQIKNKHPLDLGHRVMLHVAEYKNTSVM